MNLIFCVFWCCFWWVSSAHKISFIRLISEGKPHSSFASRVLNVENKWFKQKVDHFNPTDTRTWMQRYQMNLKYYKRGGPIFLHIGGEQEISHHWMVSGAWVEYAQKFNAMCFQLEHRYYGRSFPTENLNTTNLMYLSIEQALADLETFINSISNENDKLLLNAKWVVFGGSYSGSLAAWLRMKYPHRVFAAVSSSSPLMAKIDYTDYFMAVKNTLSNYNPKCASYITKATLTISDLLKTNDGARYIDKEFKTCSNINEKNKNDRAQLFNNLALPIGLIAQYNKDNKHNDKSFSLLKLCDIMTDKSLGNPLKRYAVLHEKLRSINKQECLSTTYQTSLSAFKETSWNAGVVKTGDRQWMYQVCTQIGNFITSNKHNHLFGKTIPLGYFTDMCRDVFGKFFNPKILYKSIQKINKMYHELKNKTSRIIYLHGSADPWNTLGLSKPKTKESVSILIKGAAHCADTYPSHSSDSPQLSNARKTVISYLQKWLNEDNYFN